MNSHYLITGAKGFVGRHLTSRLNNLDCAYTVLNRNDFHETGIVDIDKSERTRPSAAFLHTINASGSLILRITAA